MKILLKTEEEIRKIEGVFVGGEDHSGRAALFDRNDWASVVTDELQPLLGTVVEVDDTVDSDGEFRTVDQECVFAIAVQWISKVINE